MAEDLEKIALEEFKAAQRYRKILKEVGKHGLISGEKGLDLKALLRGEYGSGRSTLRGKQQVDEMIKGKNLDELADMWNLPHLASPALRKNFSEYQLASMLGKGRRTGGIGHKIQEAAGYEVFLAKKIASGEIVRPNALLTVGVPRMPVPNKHWPKRVVGRLALMGFGLGFGVPRQAIKKLHWAKVIPTKLKDKLLKQIAKGKGDNMGADEFMGIIHEWHRNNIIKGETKVLLKNPKLETNVFQRAG